MATDVKKYDYHLAACIFPAMDDEALQGLAEDIRVNGLKNPIELWHDAIIDGRNRSLACIIAGVPPRYVEVQVDDPVAYVLSKNLHRRHLTESQRAMVAARVKDMYEESAKNRQGERTDLADDDLMMWECRCGHMNSPHDEECGSCHFVEQAEMLVNMVENLPPSYGKARDKAGEAVGVSGKSVDFAEKVIESGNDDLIKAVDSGKIKVSKAAKIAALPPEAQAVEVAHELAKKNPGSSDAHVSFNSGLNEWYTPAEYIASTKAVMGSIDLDPASSDKAQETVQAETYYTAESNGLDAPWGGRIFLNPPYSTELIGKFVEKLVEESLTGEFEAAIVLVNNATDSRWFQLLLSSASAICFPVGRIRFIDRWGSPAGSPLQGQAFIYIGTEVERFAEEFYQYGAIVYTRRD